MVKIISLQRELKAKNLKKKGFMLIEFIISLSIIITLVSGTFIIFMRTTIREKRENTKIEELKEVFKGEENLLMVLKYYFKWDDFKVENNEIVIIEKPIYSISKTGNKIILYDRDVLNNKKSYMEIMTKVAEFHIENIEDVLYIKIKREGGEVWERIVKLKDM